MRSNSTLFKAASGFPWCCAKTCPREKREQFRQCVELETPETLLLQNWGGGLQEPKREVEDGGRAYSTGCYYIKRYLCGGQHCVFIQAEDGVGHDGLVGQEAAAHHLWR